MVVQPEDFPETFGLEPDAFRIVAPPAMKRAALEEDGGTDTRAIVYGKTLDIEDNSIHGIQEFT
jgi:hypothetical protein